MTTSNLSDRDRKNPAHGAAFPHCRPPSPGDIGFEAARFFPFCPSTFLARMALAGAAVSTTTIGGKATLCFREPGEPSAEHDFLVGWLNGSRGGHAMVGRHLRGNPEIAAAHRALGRLESSAQADQR